MNAAQLRDISDAVKRVPTVADEVTRRTVRNVERIRLLTSAATPCRIKNDFGAASYRSLSFTSTNTGVLNITAAKNILNQGSASHVRPRIEDAPGWFLRRNSYRMNGSTNNINLFIEPSGSPVHFVH